MAVVPMQRIELCALKKDRKKILEMLQRRGIVQVSDGSDEDDVFQKTDTSSARVTLEKGIAASREALSILNRYSPESKSLFSALEGRQITTVEHYDSFAKQRETMLQLAYRLNSLAAEIEENQAEIPKMKIQVESLVPWKSFDLPLDFYGTGKTAALIGVLPPGLEQEALEEQLSDSGTDAVSVRIVSSSPEQTCVMVLCLRPDAHTVEERLRELGFAKPAVVPPTPPAEQIKKLQGIIEECTQKIKKAREEIKSRADARDDLKFMLDYYTMRLEKYEVISRLYQSRRTFFLKGYVPKRETGALEEELSAKFPVAVTFTTPSEEEEVPVLLSNNGFSAPVESVVESYSLPGKGEVDPTAVMSIFYYVLFGMMLSDAAYGALLTVICGICLLRFKNMENSMRNTLKMFFFCGISTVFWGVLFGSYFGDVVDVVSKTFFGTHLTIPALWFAPLNQPMRMLMFCFVIGLVHLFTGLAMNFYQLARARRYKDALYDVVFWYVLIISLIILLLGQKMFADIAGVSLAIPTLLSSAASYAAILSAVGIILTGGRESRNWFKRILKGLYGLYNITGYLSDVLSYSRLLALGLATGVIATVINQMGSMAGGSAVGAVMFVIIFLLGHTMNIGINLLGAYVHTNRLQFVEFFGKFYSGGGRKFQPFAVNTQYFKFREDHKNG
ncbi:V-type ATP synthase subunit I [Caproiciproducens faecalis]|uniref:V-type ATP synthase subunit I n=1 Tax=Caproiciproducens faecalis TaxID=2820301 RepID=A0ABS7DLF0_9FIRM|nr:V-type ATP synthase subunit I [Caproiciproducens faecalis]MBW7572107.1 V-type ATP synthase subunit I [Caproiciproducens faecalis]